MPRNIASNIVTESDKSALSVIDYVDVTFPSPVGLKRWCTIGDSRSGNTYEARIANISSWTWSMNPETDDLTIDIVNVDGEITKIFNQVEVEMAQVKLVRYYPDIPASIDPLWVGYGGSMTLDEEMVSWKIHFGFRGFTQKGLRKLAQNCWKIFKDGKYCPYDGNNTGLAATLTAAMNNTQTTISLNNYNLYQKYDLIKVDSETVQITGGAGPFTIQRAVKGTAAAHNNGIKAFHASCFKDLNSCKNRRMNGPTEANNGKRYFGGWMETIPISWRQRSGGEMLTKFFTQTAIGNPSTLGKVIPAAYGACRLSNVPAASVADAREFKHALFLVAEGECHALSITNLKMGSLSPDNCPANSSLPTFDGHADWAYGESIMWWAGAPGQRASTAVNYNQTLDSYKKNPYLVNDDNGVGPSLSDLFAVHLRAEEGGDEFDQDIPSLDVQFIGRKIRTIQGWIDNDDNKSTYYPDPIEVAVDYLLNGKFGARLDKNRVDLTTALACSNYCKAGVTSQSADYANYSGSVTDSPNNNTSLVNPRNNWVFVDLSSYEIPNGALAGRTFNALGANRTQVRLIVSDHNIREIDPATDYIGGTYGFMKKVTYNNSGVHAIQVDKNWDANKTPVIGDSVTITGYGYVDQVPRFTFNGALTEDQSTEQQLEYILQNCNGYWFPDGSVIKFGIRKAVDLGAIDALPWLKDYGDTRNILRENGKSTLKVEEAAATDGAINCIEVTYADVTNNLQSTTIYVYDEDLQLLSGQVLGSDSTRVVNTKTLKLIGTVTTDQAMRLGALALREESVKRYKITFKMALKNRITLAPGDVRRLDTNQVLLDSQKSLSAAFPYVIITKITEDSKFTIDVEAFPFVNGFYDDSIVNLVNLGKASGTQNPNDYPLNVTPSTPVETVAYAKDGSVVSVVGVEVTYPS